jgi:hypothetical protein
MKIKVSLALLLAILVACLVSIRPVAAAASAVIQNDSMWIDSTGALHIFGEVKNTGDVWLRFVKITGTLRDGSGGIVDVSFTYALLDFLPPEGVAPFDLIEIDTAKSSRVQSYTLVVEFQEASALAQQLLILNVADSKNSLGWLEVVGEIENQGATPSTYTQVTGTFYDAEGKVVYVHFTYASPSEIPPAGRCGFKITVGSDERSSKITRYILTAESENSGYTSVPEFSWVTIVAAVILTLTAVALKGKNRSQ